MKYWSATTRHPTATVCFQETPFQHTGNPQDGYASGEQNGVALKSINVDDRDQYLSCLCCFCQSFRKKEHELSCHTSLSAFTGKISPQRT